MKKNFIVSIVILFVFLLPTTTVDAKIARGIGKIVSKNIQVSDFNSVKLTSSADVEITKGDKLSVVLTEYENLIDLHVITVENGTLIVKTESFSNLINSKAKIKVTLPGALYSAFVSGSGNITLKNIASLNELTVTGSGDIQSLTRDNFRHLKIKVTGSGDISMNGTAQSVNILITGSGDVNLSELSAQSADCTINGSGDIRIFAQKMLKAAINGSGDITYYGNPQLEKHVNGSGDIIHK